MPDASLAESVRLLVPVLSTSWLAVDDKSFIRNLCKPELLTIAKFLQVDDGAGRVEAES